jgi:hypothetical protein
MHALLTVEQLSKYIQKSVASIRCDATRKPHSLPPICRLPGTKRLLWRVEDVQRWLGDHVDTSGHSGRTDDTSSKKSRRGRPTKAEQVARLRNQSRKPSGNHSHSSGAETKV